LADRRSCNTAQGIPCCAWELAAALVAAPRWRRRQRRALVAPATCSSLTAVALFSVKPSLSGCNRPLVCNSCVHIAHTHFAPLPAGPQDFLCGIRGKDFVLVCSDTSAVQSIVTMKQVRSACSSCQVLAWLCVAACNIDDRMAWLLLRPCCYRSACNLQG